MVAVILLILFYIVRIRTYVGMFFAYFGLAMMLTMFVGASVYLYSPSNTSLAVAFGVNMAVMLGLLTYFFAIAEDMQKKKLTHTSLNTMSVSLLLVTNEVFMSTAFGLAQFGPKLFSSPYGSFYYTVNSYWFFYPMMAEMLGFYLIHYLKGEQFPQLLPLVGVTSFPPTAFNTQGWFPFAVAVSLGASGYGFAYSFKGRGLWTYIYASLLITTALLLVTPIPYDVDIVVTMVLYYYAILSKTFQNVSRYLKKGE
jgi:hypothetical protein